MKQNYLLLDTLEKMLVEAGTADELGKARSGSGLGLFVPWVRLDREAAKRAFDGFLDGKTLSANQIHFVNLVIAYLTQARRMSPAQMYESPFTDFSPRGVEGVFDSTQVTQLVSIIDGIRRAAVVEHWHKGSKRSRRTPEPRNHFPKHTFQLKCGEVLFWKFVNY